MALSVSTTPVLTVPGFSSDPTDLPVSMDPVFIVPGFPQIQRICQSPWTLCSQFQGFHRSSGFASLHGPCVHSSRVSSDPTDLPVSMDLVFTVPGFSSDPVDLPVSMDPVFTVPGLSSIPTVDASFNNPCVTSSWGFHRSNGFASLHGPCVSSSRVSSDPTDLPVSMDPVFTDPGFPQIQQICQSPWTLCTQFQGFPQIQWICQSPWTLC